MVGINIITDVVVAKTCMVTDSIPVFILLYFNSIVVIAVFSFAIALKSCCSKLRKTANIA